MPKLEATQASRRFAVATPLGEDVLLFHSMSASEQLGRLFQFDLDLLSEDPEIKLQDILGQSVTVRCQRLDGENRYFNGIVSQFSLIGSHGNLFVYRAILHPWFWFLTRTADCRIFQNQKVPDIIKEVFRDQGFSDFEDALSGTYREWEYCAQYRETDFNFISRLMEQEGIYYYFKHEEGKHTLVLSDSISAHETAPGYQEVPFYPPQESEQRERDHISAWSLNQTIQPGVYALNDFDFKKPRANLEVKSSIPREHEQAEFEIYDYPGEYLESSDGEAYVRARLEELQAQYEEVQGQGNVAGLMPGCLFKLTNYPREDQNREYLITTAEYKLGPQEYESAFAENDGTVFICSITAIDKQQAFRTPRITPKPIVQGPQTAIVVGKAGEEIWTDEHGRVKVQFHWDRYGMEDENSSCWMRVSQVHAGKGFGGIDIPRIGEEVIVSFLEGDPDQPIITGRVYNDDNKPPTSLPDAGMVSGLKSNSTPGGGGSNEMTMNDTKGEESMTIHAQKDATTTVENDRTTTVVGGNDTLVVEAGTRSETIKGDTTLTVQAGNRTVNVTGSYQLDTTNEITIQAPTKIKLMCGGSSITMEPSKITITAGGGANMTLDGNALTKSSAGSQVLLDSNALMASTAGDKVLLDGKATMSSSTETTLSGGGSTVTADGSGVKITSGGIVELKGAMIKHNA